MCATGWEQLAIEAARQADEQEAATEAARLQAEEDARGPILHNDQIQREPLLAQLAHLDIEINFDDLNDHELNLLGIQRAELAPVPQPQHHQQQRGRGGRRARNPYPRAPANAGRGAAQAVRAHERRQPRPAQGRNRPRAVGVDANAEQQDDVRDRQQQEELERFIELARRDQEDDWDSDGLADDDGEFEIR